MKIFTLIILIMLMAINAVLLYSEEQNDELFVPNAVIIKFKSDSPYILGHFSGEQIIERLNEMYPSFNFVSCKPIVNPKLLEIESPHNSLRRNTHNYMVLRDKLNEISKIFIVAYSTNVVPLTIARKLSTSGEIEYTEPVPVRKINTVPNDPEITYQYYLTNVYAFEAWDYIPLNDTIVVGIVDTGVDYLHPDLAANIWSNPGETGKDDLGNDKSANGLDDDGNGFVDDWRGWDFIGSQGEDNDPYPGNSHGTHVAGIVAAVANNGIGICGTAQNVKILPVKCGNDNPGSNSILRGYEGILYAAKTGAKVINCSWGSSTKSQSEQEIITAAEGFGAVIVAAAGNDGQKTYYYPSSYDGVMSVAAVDDVDTVAWFSNHHPSVDVSAPGVSIYSTVPNNSYEHLSGTSMASPCAAAVAAMIYLTYPDYLPIQVIEHVKSASDNIDSLNPYYAGLIGKGRVNALKSVSAENLKALTISNIIFKNQRNDNLFLAGDEIEIDATVLNVLSPVNNVYIKPSLQTSNSFQFIVDSVFIGEMQSLESFNPTLKLKFITPNDVQMDYNADVNIEVFENNVYQGSAVERITLNPSYRLLSKNNLKLTLNSRGNFAYNDYPYNTQGFGVYFNDSDNLLYEGAFMIAAPGRLSDVARSSNQMRQNKTLLAKKVISLDSSGAVAAEEAYCEFGDICDSSAVCVDVMQRTYQFDDIKYRNMIITSYDIINRNELDYDSLFAGLYFDWDIGPSGSNNVAEYMFENAYGIVKNIKVTTLPWVGIKLLSDEKVNFWAMDNNGTEIDNPGVYNGFTASEKWQTLSSGIGRKISNTTDISTVIGAGPVNLKSGDTARVTFAIFVANDSLELEQQPNALKELAKQYSSIFINHYSSRPNADTIFCLYPNPVTQDIFTFSFGLNSAADVTVEVFDEIGGIVAKPLSGVSLSYGKYDIPINVNIMSSGVYFIRLNTGRVSETVPVIILK